MKTKKLPALFQTVLGEHTLRRLEPAHSTGIGNSLFELTDTDGNRLGFTGDELDSLCGGWRAFKAKEKARK